MSANDHLGAVEKEDQGISFRLTRIYETDSTSPRYQEVIETRFEVIEGFDAKEQKA